MGERFSGCVGQARLDLCDPSCQGTASPGSRARRPTPLARMPKHRTVSAAHQRSSKVWWLSTVCSVFEPDSQVAQPRGRAGKDAQTV